MIKCVIEGTGNNLFVSILNQEKKLLYKCTIGLLSWGGKKLVGTKKKTVFGAELVGNFVGLKLERLGFLIVKVVISGKWRKAEQSCIRGLIKQGIKIMEISYRLKVAHNGIRLKKKRRR